MKDYERLPYTENGRAMPLNVQIGLLLTSAMLVALHRFRIIELHYQHGMIPAYFVLVVRVLYHVIRNATHEAIRLADADRTLDGAVKQAISLHSPPALSAPAKRDIAAAVLNPDSESPQA